MKKMVLILLALTLSLSLTACSVPDDLITTAPFVTAGDASAIQVCKGNRQMIVNALNTLIVGTAITEPFGFTVSYNGTTASIGNVTGIDASAIQGLFSELPYCPGKGLITVKVTFDAAGKNQVSVTCSLAAHNS